MFLSLFVFSCRNYFDDQAEVDFFLNEVTNKWWSLEGEGTNFYLERDENNEDGNLLLSFNPDPYCYLEYNGYIGVEWQYKSNDKFDIFYNNEDYQLSIKELDDQPKCWKINYGVLYSDVACPYNGSCITVY